MDDEINLTQELGRYLEMLLRQWRLIAAAILLCAFSAGLVSVLLPKQYRAAALIATTKVSGSVSFGSSIQTVSEEQLLASGAGAYRLVDPTLRLQSYVQLIPNPAIAALALEQFGARLEEQERTVDALLDMVEGEVAERSDALRISVTYSDPALAAELANFWAQAYVRQLNATYGDLATTEAYAAIQAQTGASRSDYEAAQAALEAFIARDRAAELERRISERQLTITGLVEARTAANLKAYREQLSDLQVRLEHAYADLRRLERLLDDADDMRAQVQAGGEAAAASNGLALALLKTQVFAANGGQSETLQFQTQPVTATAQAMLRDLDGLAGALQGRRELLDVRISELSAELVGVQGAQGEDLLDLESAGTPLEAQIGSLEDELRALRAELAAEQDALRELTRARDLAWETYKNLDTKLAELQVATQTASSQVALAAPAAAPDKDLVSGARNTALGGVAGLLLGVFAAYAIEFWWAYKGINPYPLLSF